MRFDSYQTQGQLLQCQRAAERLVLKMGITFNVYGDSAGAERVIPFDLIPRIVRAEEWAWIDGGLKQRIHALNEFIDDIYHCQKILKDTVWMRTTKGLRKALWEDLLLGVPEATP